LTKFKLLNMVTKYYLLDILTTINLSEANMKLLKSRTGIPAEGKEYFFERKAILQKIKRKLDNGEHLLISAPRRIGKTSLLKYLVANPDENQIVKYLIVQSVDSSERFYKKLFNELITDSEIYNSVQKIWKKSSSTILGYISRIREVKFEGIDLSGEERINYYELLNSLLKELSTHSKKIVIVLDEFPDAVANIYENDKKQGVRFLEQNREFRENYSNSSLQFIYTGSTGLRNVVRKIGELHLINNITDIKIPPFSKNEAVELLQRLVLGKKLEYREFIIDTKVIDYILEKVVWLLPYYLQIIIEELFDHYVESKTKITTTSVDEVIKSIIQHDSSHSHYFENWKSRLKSAFQEKSEYKLAIEILNNISVKDKMKKSAVNDLLVKHKKANGKYVLEVLTFDGYISFDDQIDAYGFNSHLLRQWWYINVAT
jgi:hypothetical protein